MHKPVTDKQDHIEQLFEQQGEKLANFCFRMVGNREMAQDLSSEVFLRALERKQDLDVAWLYAVARNVCIDHLRRSSGWRRVFEQLKGHKQPKAFEERLVERDLGLKILRDLNPKQRALLLLKEYVGMNYSEIADILNTTPQSVGVLLHRARKQAHKVKDREEQK